MVRTQDGKVRFGAVERQSRPLAEAAQSRAQWECWKTVLFRNTKKRLLTRSVRQMGAKCAEYSPLSRETLRVDADFRGGGLLFFKVGPSARAMPEP